MEKHPFRLLLIAGLVLGFVVVAIARVYVVKNQKQVSLPARIFANVTPGPKVTTILAPNGKMTLIVREEKTKNGMVDVFSIQDQKTMQNVQIYSETLAEGAEISVPYNTFSPDNKYIFLKKTGPSSVSYFVLKTDGSSFAKGEKTIDFLSLFNQKYPDTHTVTDVTGWGGVNLIVVNTDKSDGGISHSFWYDVSSNSFIQLSNRFN